MKRMRSLPMMVAGSLGFVVKFAVLTVSMQMRQTVDMRTVPYATHVSYVLGAGLSWKMDSLDVIIV